MNENIFRRVEEKYFLNKEQYKKLFYKNNKYIKKDKNNKINILNIYIDNNN